MDTPSRGRQTRRRMGSARRYERSDAVRVERSRWLAAAPFAGLIPLIAYLALDTRNMPDWIGLLLGIAAIVTPIVAVLTAATRAKPRLHRGAVQVDEAGVHWNGELRWARAAIATGLFVPATPFGPVVRLANPARMFSIDLIVQDEADGRALLEALDLGASQRTAHFTAHPNVSGVAAGAGLMMIGIFGAFLALRVLMHGAGTFVAWLTALASIAIPYVPLALAVAPMRITVGVDGVLLRRLGGERFVPYREVERVEGYDQGVVLVMRDGRSVRLRVGPIETRVATIRDEQMAQRDALLARLRDAMRAADDGDTSVGSARALERGGRSVREWMEHLRALAHRQEGGMRVAPVLRTHLWALLSDPNAAASDRAGAAVALARGGEEGGTNERLRVVAGAVAEPRLRVVIEAVATGSEAKIETALEALEADAGTMSRRAEE